MLSNVSRGGVFLGSLDSIDPARIVIVGAPMDYTSCYRAGSRFGPEAIRNVSDVLETYSPALDRDLSEVDFFDAGDISLPFGNVEESLKRIGTVVKEIIGSGRVPVVLGGEHLVTLPVVQEVSRYYEDLYVFHFDAHADLRTAFEGERLSHATVIRTIAEIIGGSKIFQFGIRSGTRDEFCYAKENTNMMPGSVLEAVKSSLDVIGKSPVYITIDIDVLDPAFAPGTGTPEPGGCSSSELLESIYALKDLNIVGFDIVEVNPAYDNSERTQIIGAKLLREFLLIV